MSSGLSFSASRLPEVSEGGWSVGCGCGYAGVGLDVGVGVGVSVSAGGCCYLEVFWSKGSRVEVESVVGGVNHDVTQDQCACSDSDAVR